MRGCAHLHGMVPQSITTLIHSELTITNDYSLQIKKQRTLVIIMPYYTKGIWKTPTLIIRSALLHTYFWCNFLPKPSSQLEIDYWTTCFRDQELLHTISCYFIKTRILKLTKFRSGVGKERIGRVEYENIELDKLRGDSSSVAMLGEGVWHGIGSSSTMLLPHRGISCARCSGFGVWQTIGAEADPWVPT